MMSQHVFEDDTAKHLIIGLNNEDMERLLQGDALVLPAVSNLRVTVIYGRSNREQIDRVEHIATTDPTGIEHWNQRLD